MALIFLILLVLKLDDKVDWNWFIIFIPMWLYDIGVVIYVFVTMVRHCKNRAYHDRGLVSIKRRAWYLTSLFMKLIFEIILCLRFQYVSSLSLFYVMIPLWILLIGSVVDVGKNVIGQYLPDRSS
ncbi:transmembrane protein 60-like [Lingula anatina]|nr:transmembrane protein 60-like [Lingula anatina]|eukprot:XP_013421344.2 transmembrane protein 60-like [Lingula anatina]